MIEVYVVVYGLEYVEDDSNVDLCFVCNCLWLFVWLFLDEVFL